MEVDRLVDVAPLTKGPIRNRRKEINTNLVRYVLNNRHQTSEYSPQSISAIAEQYTGIEINSAEAAEVLEELCDNDEVSYDEESGKFKTIDLEPTPDISSKLDIIWRQFNHELREQQDEINPELVQGRKRSAFDDIIFTYFEQLSESVEVLETAGKETILDDRFTQSIDQIIDHHDIDQPDEFKQALRSFLSNPGEELLELIDTIYTGAINLNILSNTTEIPFNEITEGNTGKIFLDTNLIINLLCKSSRSHDLIKVVCNRSTELDYDLYYLPSTVREVRRVIRGSKAEMNELTNPDGEFIRSQLIKDFLNRDEFHKWSEYLNEFQQWEKFLRLQYGITKFEPDESPDASAMDFVRSSIDQMERQADVAEEDRKKEEAVDHDTETLGTIATLRNDHEGNLPSAPFLLSQDGIANAISEMGEGTLWDNEIVLHPRNWLNYLLAFTSSEVDSSRRTDISKAILSSSIQFEDPLTVEEYIELLRTKLDVEADNKELLKEYILESPLSDQFTKAIERDKTNEAMKTAKEILSDEGWQEAFVERRANEEQLNHARNQIEELQTEASEAKAEASAYKQAVQTQNTVVLDIPQFVEEDNEYNTKQIAELNENLTTLITLLNKQISKDLRAEIPDPPTETSDPSELSAWIDSVLGRLNTVNSAAETVGIVRDMASETSDLLSQMM